MSAVQLLHFSEIKKSKQGDCRKISCYYGVGSIKVAKVNALGNLTIRSQVTDQLSNKLKFLPMAQKDRSLTKTDKL